MVQVSYHYDEFLMQDELALTESNIKVFSITMVSVEFTHQKILCDPVWLRPKSVHIILVCTHNLKWLKIWNVFKI